MTSPPNDAVPPNPSVLANRSRTEDGRSAEQAIDDALVGVRDLDALPVAEHVGRFEAVHSALTEALGRAESHPDPHGHGS